MAAFPGWTWEYVDECMTLPRLDSLSNYWSDHPPVHKMIAAYLGIKPKSSKPAQSDFAAFMAEAENANVRL
jgi:hypothetical protein